MEKDESLTLLPRRQFSLRALLVAMLVVAVIAWATALSKRAVEYRSRALAADELARQNRLIADTIAAVQTDAQSANVHQRLRVSRVAYYRRLKEKYELAARRPWLAVEPDGQPPDFTDGK